MHLGAPRDQHAALAGRDRLGRVQRVDAGVAVGARPCARSSSRRGRGRSPRSGRSRAHGSSAAICSTSNAMWPPMWTRNAALGLWRSRLGLEVRERHAEVLAVAVDELHLGAGTDRRQRRGHERVRRAQHRSRPAPARNRSAASAPPAQLEAATAGTPFQASHAASKRPTISPSDQRPESSTSSISACSRARSRGSNPIANRA